MASTVACGSNGMGALLLAAAILSLSALARADDVAALDLAVGPGTRLLVLAPHPDDEALGAAGLIRRVVAAGGRARVVVVTSGDAFAEGVETIDGIANPRPRDYRGYGTLREHESREAMGRLGVDAAHVTFLGFPDEGLCLMASKYLSAKSRAFESPFTDRISPPLTEQVVRGVTYRGYDVRREIERIVLDYRPTLLAMPHPEDEHPDHCSTHIFGTEALAAAARQGGPRPRVLHYLVHYGQWPLSSDAGAGSELRPPSGFPTSEGQWRSLALTREEADAKKQALLAYASQMMVIGRFMLAFGRDNELFLEGEPVRLPECWCDGENVATELPPSRYRRRPSHRP
jgi:LmbE family N-acetylglucosaminyl deacetylase